MPSETCKSIEDMVRDSNFPLEAFEFLHDGLDYAVQRIHGPPKDGLRQIASWLDQEKLELTQLPGQVDAGRVPPTVMHVIHRFGGVDSAMRLFNRHISGEDLCWGLRELALARWGLLASTVLRCWGIRDTRDFGRMVFALVERGLLQKQAQDRIGDFDNVYDFATALDRSYKISLTEPDVDPEPRPKAAN